MNATSFRTLYSMGGMHVYTKYILLPGITIDIDKTWAVNIYLASPDMGIPVL